MVILVVVTFRDEEGCLDTMLESMVQQDRRPDHMILVDDGSTDGSPEVAAEFAARHEWLRVLRRPQRPRERDRLREGSVWQAVLWALEQTPASYDILAKVDADLRLPPDFLSHLERRFEQDPRLGMAGAHLSALDRRGRLCRERNPIFHVRGATKLYRRECFEQIAPIPPILGWDTIDEVKARMRGWTTSSFEIPSGDPVQMRPTGSLDGNLRAFRRYGRGAYAYGAHPLHVMLGAVRRIGDRPWGLGAINYLAGWLLSIPSQVPRADPDVRAFARQEQLDAIRGLLTRHGRR